MEIKIKLDKPECMPKKAHPTDAGYDLIASHVIKQYNSINEDIHFSKSDKVFIIEAHGRALIGTGVYLELPIGWYAKVTSRSGLSLKKGLEVLNSPGIIDANYRGEVGVILHNTTSETLILSIGERIAQIIFSKLPKVDLKVVSNLDKTDRGEGGFGSSGV